MGLDDIVDKAKDLAGDAADKAKDMAGDVADKAKDVAGDVADKAKDVAGEVKDRADHLIHGDDDKPEAAPASGGTGRLVSPKRAATRPACSKCRRVANSSSSTFCAFARGSLSVQCTTQELCLASYGSLRDRFSTRLGGGQQNTASLESISFAAGKTCALRSPECATRPTAWAGRIDRRTAVREQYMRRAGTDL